MAGGLLGRSVLGFLTLISVALTASAANLYPISDAHRSAALELFVPIDGSFTSLEETYEALRTFQILGVDKTSDIHHGACSTILDKLGSSASKPKDYFDALRVNNIAGCQVNLQTLENVASQLQSVLKSADSLMDLYYCVLSLNHIKGQGANVVLSDADGLFHFIKALSLSDGRWRYDSNSAESSTYAAGLALEALAGVISLADSQMDQSKIGVVKHDIVKLFGSIKHYDDGTLYFDEKHINSMEYKGPLVTTASVVRGVTAFAAAAGKLNIPGDKIVGLAKFLLSIGVPGSAEDLFNQIDSLSCLEDNSEYVFSFVHLFMRLFQTAHVSFLFEWIFIPLILSLPATVFSLTSKDQLKVEVTTVLGSTAPPLTVSLVQAYATDSKKNIVLEKQELNFDPQNNVHYLDMFPLKIDVGKYKLDFEISLQNSEHLNTFASEGHTTVLVFLTGLIEVETAEIGVLDSDAKSTAGMQKLDLSKDSMVQLSANHLQKMFLTFQLMTPRGHIFKPHQVFLKLKHESKVEHIFTVNNSGKLFEIELKFLGLVDKLYYLSGRYELELIVGDVAMENSFLHSLGHIELDLPEPSGKASRPPPQPVDPYLRFGPKNEISHIFRAPEKRPPEELSIGFLVLTLLPLGGLLTGLLHLGVNLKGFPSSSVPALFAVLFHAGIGAVLVLYVLFWCKLDLFTTLKALGLLGIFLIFVGHKTLSHLASSSTKLKTN